VVSNDQSRTAISKSAGPNLSQINGWASSQGLGKQDNKQSSDKQWTNSWDDRKEQWKHDNKQEDQQNGQEKWTNGWDDGNKQYGRSNKRTSDKQWKNGWDSGQEQGSYDNKGWNEQMGDEEDTFVVNVCRENAIKVIGKQGATKKAICHQSGAKVQISPDEGSLTITGSLEAVDKARAMVYDVLVSDSRQPDPGSLEDEAFLMLKSDVADRFENHPDNNRRWIEQKSWAYVDAKRRRGNNVLFHIHGKYDAVEEARNLVQKALVDVAMSDGRMPLKRKRFESEEQTETQLEFPTSATFAVLGRSGEKVRQVKSQSGATVRQEKTADGLVLKISGAPESVKRARLMLEGFSAKASNNTVVTAASSIACQPSNVADGQGRPTFGGPPQREHKLELEFENQAGRIIEQKKWKVESETGSKVRVQFNKWSCEVTILGQSHHSTETASRMIEDIAKFGDYVAAPLLPAVPRPPPRKQGEEPRAAKPAAISSKAAGAPPRSDWAPPRPKSGPGVIPNKILPLPARQPMWSN